MPPKETGFQRGDQETDRWVAEGMAWDEGIRLGSSGWEPPLKPIVKRKLPRKKESSIDRLLDNYWPKTKTHSRDSEDSASSVERTWAWSVSSLPRRLGEIFGQQGGEQRRN